ncbi:MAG: hypothetical protein DRR06_04725 [Gammaproteobacteria bacterium]|nr:MAG: hypothetical protein DRR06_04725 [Gammaproteobacteria bacterium]RLA52991.1 MAG: hypothetical protein DRR42_06115 [Gammaproteobacteria bacterium]
MGKLEGLAGSDTQNSCQSQPFISAIQQIVICEHEALVIADHSGLAPDLAAINLAIFKPFPWH